MLFNSWQYAVFLPLVAVLYFIIPHKWRWAVLLVASYYFYMSWNAKLVVLIATTTFSSYICALCIEQAKKPAMRKAILCVGAFISLGLLFFFKYFNFLSVSVTSLLRSVSLPVDDFTINVILPVGISFYTFQTLSYVIDVYRGTLKAERHLGIYALYVSFFPQLVAGPIERAVNLLPQFYIKHTLKPENLAWGLRMIAWGLFKKLAIADVFAVYVNKVYDAPQQSSATAMLLATVFFAFQIYCDFSGYSDIALGSARILGFNLMENFKSPYFAFGLRSFWRRWHISLSSWMSDYIYIPLGGSRCKPLRQAINLAVTFFASGMWHGASWNFVLWGIMQGALVITDTFTQPMQKALKSKIKKPWLLRAYNFIGISITFLIVCYSWVLFRAYTISDILLIIKGMTYSLCGSILTEFPIALSGLGISGASFIVMALKIAVLMIFDYKKQTCEDMFAKLAVKRPAVRFIASYLLSLAVILTILITPENAAVDFIYFQF